MMSPLKITLYHDPFDFLIYTILGQQISVKQADRVYQNLSALSGSPIKPETLASLSDTQLKQCGIPGFKTRYIRAVQQAVINETLSLTQLAQHNHQKRLKALTKIPGIGPWSAEMYCIFVLGDLTIFSLTDKGLQNGLKTYLNRSEMTLKEIQDMAKLWEPYPAIVAHYLWAYWDKKGE